MLKAYRKKYWDKKRYCERYGHTVEESIFSGLHVGKQMRMHRHTKFCKHCGAKLLWEDTPLEEKPHNYGVSFGSEGVCNHCLNQKKCDRNPYRYSNTATYVYTYCPIDNFKGSKEFYEKIKNDDTIITR